MYDFEPSCWGQIVLTWWWELSWSWLISHSYFCCPCVHKSTSRGPLETHYVLWTPVLVLLQCSIGNFDYLEFLVWTRVHFFTFFGGFLKSAASASGCPWVAPRNGTVPAWLGNRLAIFKNLLSLMRWSTKSPSSTMLAVSLLSSSRGCGHFKQIMATYNHFQCLAFWRYAVSGMSGVTMAYKGEILLALELLY